MSQLSKVDLLNRQMKVGPLWKRGPTLERSFANEIDYPAVTVQAAASVLAKPPAAESYVYPRSASSLQPAMV